MAISFNYELEKKNRLGKYPVNLRITENRKHKRFRTTVILSSASDWNQKKQCVRSSETEAGSMNAYLERLLEKANRYLRELTEKEIASAGKVFEMLSGEGHSQSFYEFAERRTKEIYEACSIQTYKKYNGFCNKFKSYAESRHRDPYGFKFKEITPEFLGMFEAFLHTQPNQQYKKEVKSLNQNTIAKSLNVFKAIFSKAVEYAYVKPEENPFNHYKVKTVETTREELTVDEVNRILELNLPVGGMEWNSRNVFMFDIFTAGMRISDILKLRWRNITDGRLVYQMGKNRKTQNIKLLDEALAIANLYRTEETTGDDFIFPYLTHTKNYELWRTLVTQRDIDNLTPEKAEQFDNAISAKVALVNKGLGKIRTKAKISKPLSTHVGRHTFAALAKIVGTDNLLLKNLLLHSNLQTTEVYMGQFGTSAKDDAMRAIIEPLLPEAQRKHALVEEISKMDIKDIEAMLKDYKDKKTKKENGKKTKK